PCLGTTFCETLFRLTTERGVSGKDGPKQEFGNEVSSIPHERGKGEGACHAFAATVRLAPGAWPNRAAKACHPARAYFSLCEKVTRIIPYRARPLRSLAANPPLRNCPTSPGRPAPSCART